MQVDLTLERLRPLLADCAAGLCNACLGRAAARLPDGLGNAERGARLRPEGAPEPDPCPLCEGLLARVEEWTRLCLDAAEGVEHDTFLVGSVLFDGIRERETALYQALRDSDPELAAALPARPNSPPWPLGEWLRTEINREVGKRIEKRTGKRVELARPDLTYRVDTRFDHVSLQIADLFVQGRYRKLARDLPQTRWPCRACGGLGCRQCGGAGKTYPDSVEELVAAPFVEASGAEGEAFHGMGREDIDARMLGTGRPFILELKRPRRRRIDWDALALEVNRRNPGRVEVEAVGPASPDSAAAYKAADPDKTYQAECLCDRPPSRPELEEALQALEGASLEQRTPQRVSHRRADLVRRRSIQRLRLLRHEGARFTLEIRADSGTYIKEFVSGDEGRTRPSLSQRLGASCRVTALDVVAIHFQEDQGAAAPPEPRANA